MGAPNPHPERCHAGSLSLPYLCLAFGAKVLLPMTNLLISSDGFGNGEASGFFLSDALAYVGIYI